jgi:hypothetical protein
MTLLESAFKPDARIYATRRLTVLDNGVVDDSTINEAVADHLHFSVEAVPQVAGVKCEV